MGIGLEGTLNWAIPLSLGGLGGMAGGLGGSDTSSIASSGGWVAADEIAFLSGISCDTVIVSFEEVKALILVAILLCRLAPQRACLRRRCWYSLYFLARFPCGMEWLLLQLVKQ